MHAALNQSEVEQIFIMQSALILLSQGMNYRPTVKWDLERAKPTSPLF